VRNPVLRPSGWGCETIKMKTSHYLRPAQTHNGAIRTDLPLIVAQKASKKKVAETASPGQLLCVGKVYLKTDNGLIRIK
jgi:hypothetical protein